MLEKHGGMPRTVNQIPASDDTGHLAADAPLVTRRMFFGGVAVTLLAAASASQAGCLVTTRTRPEPRPVRQRERPVRRRRRPMRYDVRRRRRPGGRVLLLPRNVMAGDELMFDDGTVAVVRRVYPDRVAVARGRRTVTLRAEFY
jgi:hypothetical protein